MTLHIKTPFMSADAQGPDQQGHRTRGRLFRFTMIVLGGLALGVMASGPHAQAQQDTRLETTRAQHDLSGHPGQATRRLLEWQRSGRGASSHRQELAGPVQSAIWQRYVKSFTHEIPEQYIDTQAFGNQ
ncbi:uncharacterized protein DUF3613 [Chromohalobacter marismortui]|uniref:Uncharacterized protein DUF3613 n=1 Tax=Chromohalobacter marismortui TaxID=42055 RepID=A0A4R7NVA8_9GAMM|nr:MULTISPECIES: DUF3613 domain-containing protein [Chromohalobacter]MCI0510311.1 DUF3613 domain-containing protein [Chromohalobacter sp.]MCI0594006.1 DUF3613 domain-containing protein [Chromohalobacter sp.]TDU25114.1 uncharacterized protein DUF3613 [Chromohalobacter marismortui]